MILSNLNPRAAFMLEADSLSMHYGPLKALDNVSFAAPDGEILGLLGPNGAGKTTIMRILTTYLYPSGGTARIENIDIKKNPIQARAAIGYLPENIPLYPDMLTSEYLEFIASARGVDRRRVPERLRWVMENCGLKDVWRYMLAELSKGYRQRVGLAQALIHDPKVVILDEPTSGLDPLQIIDIRRLIKSLARQKTVIFSSHILQEVEALAGRIVIINDGRLIAKGTQKELITSVKKEERVIAVIRISDQEILKTIGGIPFEVHCRTMESLEGGFAKFAFTSKANSPLCDRLFQALKEKGIDIREYREKKETLEEAFISLLEE